MFACCGVGEQDSQVLAIGHTVYRTLTAADKRLAEAGPGDGGGPRREHDRRAARDGLGRQ